MNKQIISQIKFVVKNKISYTYKKLYLFIFIFSITTSHLLAAQAACSQGYESPQTKDPDEAVIFCAIGENDEKAQIQLAQYYQDKSIQTKQDKMKMLFYYHLAAESGNARAQVALAKLLMRMDENNAERQILSSYMSQMQTMMDKRNMLFKGEVLHPYALLSLAAEDASQKWYYPTAQKSDGEAQILLGQYKITPERKKEVLRQATLWKQQKMKETAKEVLTSDQYKTFMQTVYPEKGQADAFERSQAINLLKEKIAEYLN